MKQKKRTKSGMRKREGLTLLMLGEDGAGTGKSTGTEKAYFRILREKFHLDQYVSIVKPPNHNGTIGQIVKIEPKANHTWVLIDADFQSNAGSGCHTPEQFRALDDWEKANETGRHVVISSPRIEFWLLLHFVSVKVAGQKAGKDIDVASVISGYTKNLDGCKQLFSRNNILKARDQAKIGQQPTCQVYYQEGGETSMKGSLMWKLVDYLEQLPKAAETQSAG